MKVAKILRALLGKENFINDEDLDHSKMKKGKYFDKTASEVAEIDPNYLVWAYDTWMSAPCSNLLYQECKKEIEEERRLQPERRQGWQRRDKDR